MITIVSGMTPAQFISAINSDFSINETTIVGTENSDTLKAVLDANYDYMKNIIWELPVKSVLTVGMKGRSFIDALNQNYQNINSADTDADGFVNRFTLKFDVVTTTPTKTMGLGFWCGSIPAAKAPLIKWGDGTADTIRTVSPDHGYDVPQQHVYATVGTYHVQIQRSWSIIQVLANGEDNFACVVPASQFLKATPNIEDIYGALPGNFSGLAKLKKLQLYGMTADYICDLATLVNIEDLYLYSTGGVRTGFYGDVTGLIKMKHYYIAAPSIDDNSYYGDISNWSQLMLLEQDSNYVKSQLTGTILGSTVFETLCFTCYKPIIIDITNCMNLEYWSGNCTSIGYGGDKVKMWYGPAGTGPFDALVHLRYMWGIKRLNTHPLAEYVNNSTTGMTDAEINQFLADLWANKDVDHGLDAINGTTDTGTRSIELRGATNGKPSGQGITDLTNLRAYRSPGNGGGHALWTINVNV